MVRMIDLFAGIGGVRLGFELAIPGAETVFASEWDPKAAETYSLNFPTPMVSGDITEISADEVPPFDICLAGFPCQAFSVAGRRMGFDDSYKGMSRGTLFWEVVRICDRRKPLVIFCENVKGLVRHDKGRTFKVICGAFEEVGYKVFSKVLNSRDFGVPQNRERVYIVAFREDVAPASFSFPAGRGEPCSIRDILDPAPVPSRYYLSERYLEVLKAHRKRHEEAGHGFGYVIRDLDGVSGAVVCGGMGREGNLIVDRREHSMVPTTNIKSEINRGDVRKMTPREWARLQGFPESFKLELADTHLYKQLGNTVTVPVIRAIAEKIGEVIA